MVFNLSYVRIIRAEAEKGAATAESTDAPAIIQEKEYKGKGDTLIVHFKQDAWEEAKQEGRENGLTGPYIYMYHLQEQGVAEITDGWPGTKLTKEEKASENGVWYSYSVAPTVATQASVIFTMSENKNGITDYRDPANQEPGYQVSGEVWYADGIWYTTNPYEPIITQTPDVTVTPIPVTIAPTKTPIRTTPIIVTPVPTIEIQVTAEPIVTELPVITEIPSITETPSVIPIVTEPVITTEPVVVTTVPAITTIPAVVATPAVITTPAV